MGIQKSQRRKLAGLLAGATLLGGLSAAPAFADVSLSPMYSTLTVLQDTSNLASSTTTYSFNLFTDDSLYINDIQISPQSGFDPNINFADPNSGFPYFKNNTQGLYSIGTELPGGFSYEMEIVNHFGAAPDATLGLYDFTVDIYGGDNAGANDILGSYDLTVEVYSKLDVSGTAVAVPSTIAPGDTTTVSMTLTNNMVDRDFLASSHYYVNDGMEDGAGHALENAHFIGTWYNLDLAPGESYTDGHTTWDATANTPDGLYTGNLGVSGGINDGDRFDIRGTPTVTVVPEPASLGLMIPGLLLLLRRRSA